MYMKKFHLIYTKSHTKTHQEPPQKAQVYLGLLLQLQHLRTNKFVHHRYNASCLLDRLLRYLLFLYQLDRCRQMPFGRQNLFARHCRLLVLRNWKLNCFVCWLKNRMDLFYRLKMSPLYFHLYYFRHFQLLLQLFGNQPHFQQMRCLV